LFDLLNLLLEARDDQGEGMWGQQLRDEVITLILAGHETTSLVLSWTLNLLSRKPEVEAKLLAEIGQVTGGNPPSVDKLPLLPYTAAVIKEVLCLYPPAYAVPRQALEDVAIGGYLVPRGLSVVFSLWVIRRDERFFPEPHSFYPERWLDKGKGRSEVAKNSFYPFRGGAKACIQAAFAKMGASLGLAALLQRFEFRLESSVPIQPVPSITLRPAGGVPMRLVRRTPDH
jgi:cytochrome P450